MGLSSISRLRPVPVPSPRPVWLVCSADAPSQRELADLEPGFGDLCPRVGCLRAAVFARGAATTLDAGGVGEDRLDFTRKSLGHDRSSGKWASQRLIKAMTDCANIGLHLGGHSRLERAR